MLKKIKIHFIHETKKRVAIKFILLFSVIFAYFLLLANKYGISEGFSVTTLTWAFFVLCTPVADAGFLLDFPVRLITGLKMIYSEFIVWLLAISISSYFLFINPLAFQSNFLLKTFEEILSNPFPYWGIIIISSIGTFFSIYFGDELIDTTKHIHRKKHQKHKSKHHLVILLFFIIAIIIFYDILLKKMGINMPI